VELYLTVPAIQEGEQLIFVPYTAMLSLSAPSFEKSHFASLVDSLDLTPTNAQAFWLYSETYDGDRSFWYPYIRALPKDFDTSIYYRTPESQALQSSNLVREYCAWLHKDWQCADCLPLNLLRVLFTAQRQHRKVTIEHHG
jgi:hypothetical protein